MKTKILKEFSAKIVLENGAICEGKYTPRLNTFFLSDDNFNTPINWSYNLRIKNIDDDGKITFTYLMKGYNETTFVLSEENNNIEFIDEIYIQKPKEYDDRKQHPVKFIFHVEYDYFEIPDNEVSIKIRELAKDDTCEYFHDGTKEYSIKAKVGETFKTTLLKQKPNHTFTIVEVNNSNIVLERDDGKRYVLDGMRNFKMSDGGGYNTRYDYYTWDWSFYIELENCAFKKVNKWMDN